MLGNILIAIVVLVAAFVIVVATRPAEFHIERSIALVAPPASVFAQVNDLHAWAGWSPWEKLDPNQAPRTPGRARAAKSGRGA
jgi:hypothetical protein